MIAFQNVSKVYTKSTALEDVTFKIEPGEFVSLVGKSGAGKSTVIKLLIGEERPSKGRVAFGDCEVNKLRTNELPGLRRQIGIVFQDFRLLSGKTAYENVAFAMEVGGKSQAEIEDLVPKVLDMVGLADRARNFPNELSGGEKQRVAIARAMVNRPAVIVADEPTGNLDPMNTWDIIHLLQKINSLGTTIILATHSKEIIDRLEKRVLSLDMGRLIRDDKVGRYILS
ncbi:MAG: cell division ATP-binding protein FtsE [Candidatus Harrisonbacteria bacterium]|nr:cell division ATP-binding protein FtsE [Candidatus Harrisonbacteria bacterium]MBI3114766.1 cell division ATP-binding protein FtsE [Candidatus Harrisonbacteria bacterium]